jgi:hypothetical protein
MSWNRRAVLTRGTIVLVLAIGVVALMMTAGLAGTGSSAARSTTTLTAFNTDRQTIIVKPNGVDDTADIQAAFNACTGYGRTCTVQLVKGTYYTSQITVFGFQGTFVGMGQGSTTVLALPNLPDPTSFPGPPPSPTNPWPALFTFVNGELRISQMTISEPYSTPLSAPGWFTGTGFDTALFAIVLVTGVQAYASVDNITVLGGPGDAYGVNNYNGISFSGQLGTVGNLVPLAGAFSATSTILNAANSFDIEHVVNAQVMVCFNTMVNTPFSLAVVDASNSHLLFCGNHASSTFGQAGLEVLQGVTGQQTPSTLYLLGNVFQVNDAADAAVLEDFGPVSTMSAVLTGNVFQTDTSCGCYYGAPVIFSYELKSLVVSENWILGGWAGIYVVGGPAVVGGNTIVGNDYGVFLDFATHVGVLGNGIKNSAVYGIAVTDGSSYNTMAGNVVKNSGVDDLYWDGTGTGNVWSWNVCQTSSPPGLC